MNTIEPVRKSIHVKATPERAFTVFAKCDWWPESHSVLPEGTKRKEVVIEPRVNGAWYERANDGTRCDWGKVLAWDPPRRMLLGWQLNGAFKYDANVMTELELRFTPDQDGTRVDLEHRGFDNLADGRALRDAVDSDNGWSGLLGAFAEATKATTISPGAKFFVSRLIPPRPTFMADMSETEGAALGAHVTYWTGLLDKKQALIFGPVGDPAGVWGLGVFTAADEADAQKIVGEDPAITSGIGFKADLWPMLRAVVAS